MLSVGVKNNFFYVLDVLTQIYFRLIRNLCTFAIKMAKVLRLGIKNKSSKADINTAGNYPNTQFKVYDVHNKNVYEYDKKGIKSISNW